jgi:transposase
VRHRVCALARPSPRCSGRQRTVAIHTRAAAWLPLDHGRAYEGNETRQLALDFGFIPVVPPKSHRVEPWQYKKALYRKRNEIERLFRRLKGFRRIFSRFDKLDLLFIAFIYFALIIEALR